MKIRDMLIGAAVLLFLFWNPATRQIILFILPLGSGVDDLVFLILAVVTIIFGLAYYAKRKKEV